jgi:hypothetical protein
MMPRGDATKGDRIANTQAALQRRVEQEKRRNEMLFRRSCSVTTERLMSRSWNGWENCCRFRSQLRQSCNSLQACRGFPL